MHKSICCRNSKKRALIAVSALLMILKQKVGNQYDDRKCDQRALDKNNEQLPKRNRNL